LGVLEKCTLGVKYKGKSHPLRFLVIKTKPRTEMVLGIKSIKTLNLAVLEAINESKCDLVTEFKNLFKGIERIKTVDIKLKQNYETIVTPCEKSLSAL